MSTKSERIRCVVLGGGTGIHPVLLAAQHLDIDCTSIVTVADSGGSTGILRDLYDLPAVGDLRQSLTGMLSPTADQILGKLLEYRFQTGAGLKGHTLGNLLLTALQDLTKSTTQAAKVAGELFSINGTVLPVTEANTQLQITYTDGSSIVGQHHLNEKTSTAKKIDQISYTTAAPLNPAARAAIEQADILIIGPGDYYDSILATLIVDGIPAACAATQAKIVYMVNLMTSQTRTKNMTARDHVQGIEKALGKKVTHIVINNEAIPSETVAKYALADSSPVRDDLGEDSRVIRAALISDEQFVQNPADSVERSLLRHSHTKLQTILETLL